MKTIVELRKYIDQGFNRWTFVMVQIKKGEKTYVYDRYIYEHLMISPIKFYDDLQKYNIKRHYNGLPYFITEEDAQKALEEYVIPIMLINSLKNN